MNENARRWRTPATSVAAATVGVFMLAGATASAQPAQPLPPQPGPSVVTQSAATPNTALTPAVPNTALTVPATPQTALTPAVPNAALTQPAVAAAAAPGGIATPQVGVPAQAAITPATAGTVYDFFRDKGVALEPQVSQDFKALNIVLPMPRGWAHVPDPNVTDAFAVIADRVGGNGLYSSNAQVQVYKLVGEFDPREAISHGFVDSQQLPAWRSTNGSMGEVGGMTMSTIEGTYRENSMTLDTSRRHVIATNGPDKYLVSLAVTTSEDQVVAAGEATDAIVNGFKVSIPAPPGATPPAAPAAAPAAPAPAVAVAPAPTALGAQAQPTIRPSG
ncbi:LpqN/LpqT family lipoprotein [Mycolicibacterium tusciae]|uniref:LpqN/LpqT family lipoprotein n=1 Tax=Mycolicibacterium tusciae TaxID=75922 RepID=UPI00024A46E7|nr:LpqN/LpqT family lipoprotein [Mycolicibacterium tusciae]